MAKIGLLYLNKGKWENRQVISAEWIESSTQPYIDGRWAGEDYGYQWWVPLGANDEFNAQGIYTQFIYIDPDKDMVIVKLSSNYHFKNDTTGYFHDHEIELYRTIAENLGLSY